MKFFKYTSVVWLLLFCGAAVSQVSETSHSRQYADAKLLFNQGKYNLAMEAFKPLIQVDETNPYSAYSSFYYAISAYREGYLPMAKNMLLQVRQLYAGWSKIDEVNLWLANIYFELQENNSALNVLKSVKGKQDERFSSDLKKYHLGKIEKIEVLKSLQNNNNEDPEVAHVLAQKIASLPLEERDQELLDKLIEEFDLDYKLLDVPHIAKTVYKDQYRVAVLLPFIVNTLEPVDKPKVNQFVLDLYQGMQMAVDSLKNAGINIELLAYDTKRDSATTAGILAKDELKGVDLIVGPLYSKVTGIVTEFAYRNQINVINPFFSNSELTGKNPFSFLFKPCSEDVGIRAAEYATEHARNDIGIIFYEDAKKDSVLAFNFKQRITKDSFNIIINKRIKKDSSRSILDMLLISNEKIKEASTEEAKENYTIGLDSVSFIFVASDNDLISSKVISAVETRGDSIMVIGSADWMQLPAINYETYSRLKTVLYAPDYMPGDTLGYDGFRKKYVMRHKRPPTALAADGFELMMFMGKSLEEYGKYFQLGWNKQGYMPGVISYGFNYKDANTNQVIPIISFREEKMKVIINRETKRDAEREE